MPEEYFDVAYINFDKAILHGRAVYRTKQGVRLETEIEQVLSEDQREKLIELNDRYHRERDKLLSSFVDRAALIEAGRGDGGRHG